MPDPLIVAKEGDAPAYRGLAYVVFELFDLTDYGNRIPQISIEVYKAVGDLETIVKGVAIIAGNEFGFDTVAVKQSTGVSENRHTLVAPTDWTASLDRLMQLAPNAGLQCLFARGSAMIFASATAPSGRRSMREARSRPPIEWTVCGVTRSNALVVSYINGKAAYGGAPNDASVLRAIADLKARGFAVTLLPFIMMDIKGDNTLPDPYGGAAQAPYPWRGRITCYPAPGRPGTPDKTGTAASRSPPSSEAPRLAISVGRQRHGLFRARRMDLSALCCCISRIWPPSLASIALSSGRKWLGLDDPIRCRNLSVRHGLEDAGGRRPLDCGQRIKIGYRRTDRIQQSHRPGDGSGDVYFHLDPLWSDSNIDSSASTIICRCPTGATAQAILISIRPALHAL